VNRASPPGTNVIVAPSVVMVVGAVIVGNGMVTEPSIMVEPPIMMVDPSESVMVSDMLPTGYVVLPITMAGSKPRDARFGEVLLLLLDVLLELEEIGLVVPGIVVTDPSGSVEIMGKIVVSDCVPPLPEGDTGSVVPGIVVTDPSGSVDVVGRIVVSDWLPEGETDSVVPGIVVTDPSGSVDVNGWIVVRD
jgi:hypothetical protein